MSIKNISTNNLIANIKWQLFLFCSTTKKQNNLNGQNETIKEKENLFKYDDELKYMTTEEINYFLHEGRDFWKQIRINEKIKEISVSREYQQFSNETKHQKKIKKYNCKN